MRTEVAGESLDEDCKGETEELDAGFVFGGAMNFERRSMRWLVDVRYTVGMRTVDTGSVASGTKNRLLAVLAGVGF